MKISGIPLVLFNKDIKSTTNTQANGLQQDVFEKSETPSFKGIGKKLFGKKKETRENIIKRAVQETYLEALVDIFGDKSKKCFLQSQSRKKMKEFLSIFNSKDFDIDFVTKKFEDAGIDTVWDFQNYLSTYAKTGNTFKGQVLESLEICSQLKSNEDLSKYGELLIYLQAKNSTESREEKTVNLNKVTDFLKSVKVNNINEFDNKFSHLKEYFNDFNGISDKYEAISYLMATYSDKISLINEALNKETVKKSVSAETIYGEYSDIIDYLYEHNDDNDMLKTLSSIISQIASGKLSKKALDKIPDDYFDRSSIEDRISFYKILTETGVTTDDINMFVKKSIIKDNDIISCIESKDRIVKKILSTSNVNEAEALTIYKKNSDILNVLCPMDDFDEARFETFFKLKKMFNLSDSKDLLKLYRDVNVVNANDITARQLEKFIDTMSYCPSPSFIKDAKAKRIKPIDALEAETNKFLNIKEDIEKYLENEKTGYFLGLSARDVYFKYAGSFDKAEPIGSTLDTIIKLNIESSNEYVKKAEQLNILGQHIADRRKLLAFAKKAGIKFDGTVEDKKLIENCDKILKHIKDVSDDEQFEKRVDSLMQSKFILNSKDSLDDFFACYGNKEKLSEALTVITDKKVPSLDSLVSSISKQSSTLSRYTDAIERLNNIDKDIDFQEYSRIMNLLEKTIKEAKISVKLDNENIYKAISFLKGKDSLSANNYSEFFGILRNAEKGNFLCTFKNSFSNKENQFDTFAIAYEIVTKMTPGQDPYTEIMNKLGIDMMQSDETCPYYTEVDKVMEKIPQEFVDFINSNEWVSFDDSDRTPNLSLHARMRMIERFAFDKCDKIDDLNKDGTKNHLKDILKSIYTGKVAYLPSENDKYIVTKMYYEGKPIEAVFSKDGKMITIIAKYK